MSNADMSAPAPGQSLVRAYENDPLRFFNEPIHNSCDFELYDEPRWKVEIDDTPLSSEKSDYEIVNEQKLSRSTKAKIASGLLIGATFGALAFEQSPGNESVRATAALEVLENTSDPLAAGGMVAGLTVVIEGVTGTLIAAGLNREKNFIGPKLERFKDKLVDDPEKASLLDGDEQKKKSNGIAGSLADTGITCTLGPGMVVARRHIQGPTERSFKKDIKSLTGYTAVGAGVSGVIGYLATGGVKHADKVGLGVPAEYFVDYATDWKFWTGLLTVGWGGKWVYNKARNVVGGRNMLDKTL